MTGVAALLNEAEAAANAKDWPRAAELLSEAGDTTPVLESRSFYLSRAGQYPAAIEVLRVLAEREPSNHRWPYMIGYQYSALEQYRDAVPWYRRALELNPRHLKSWWRAANALDKAGDEAAAVRCAIRVLKLWNALPEEAKDREKRTLAKASFYLGKVQMRTDPHGAVALLEQALAHESDDPWKEYRLGKALHYSGNRQAALPHLERAQRMKRDDPHIELELADVLASCGEKERALTLIRKYENRLRGHSLRKAGKAASAAGDQALAVRLLRRAASDNTLRRNERLQGELAAAEARLSEMGLEVAPPPLPGGRLSGCVKMVNLERNFGFLVDDEGRVSRHFRPRGQGWKRGDKVTYIPGEGAKGPNASDVRAA